jgi:hypothetical protein
MGRVLYDTQPGDELLTWSKAELIRMDWRFCEAVRRALEQEQTLDIDMRSLLKQRASC